MVPVSAVIWNPWGLVGRHEIRLVVMWAAIGVAAWFLVRMRTIAVPRRWPVGAALILLLLVSSVVARDWNTTWWGHADRHLGVIGWVSLFVAALVGINLSENGRAALRVAIEVAGVIVATLALGQVFAASLFGDAGPGGRPTSTFGSATYTGAFLAIALVFLVDRVRVSDDRRVQVGAGLASSATLVALALSGSRGAWIGGAVGLISLAVAWRHDRRMSPGALALGSVIVVGLTAAGSSAFRERIASLFDPTSGTAGGRFVLWRSGVDAMFDRPLFGWGPDRSRVGLPPSLPRSFEAEYWDQTIPDRAHNALIDFAIVVGVPAAVLAGIAAFGTLGLLCGRHVLRGGSVNTVWVAASCAHVPHLMFNFVQLDLDVTAALIFGVATSSTAIAVDPPRFARAGLSFATTVTLSMGVVFAGGLTIADHIAGGAVRAEQSGQLSVAAGRYERATTWSFGSSRSYELLARFERRNGDFAKAIAAADLAAARHRDDLFYGELSALVRAEATVVDAGFADDAIVRYRGLLARWPNHGAYHTGIGVAEARRGDVAAAERSFRQAIELSPLSPEPYANLARLLAAIGDGAGALQVLETGIETSVEPSSLVALRNELG